MKNFGNLEIGTLFKFKGHKYTKVDNFIGISIQSLSHSVRFFSKDQKVILENQN